MTGGRWPVSTETTPRQSTSRYRTIVADPPWEMATGGPRRAGNRARASAGSRLAYETMPVDQIAALVPPSADDAHLYLWTINSHVESAYLVARAWGFKPSTLIVWCKAPKNGPGGAFAINTEFVLYARKGSLSANRIGRNWWQWPRGEHSAKPDAFYDIVESVSPGPYLEMFARRARFGWDYWGNESLGTAELPEVPDAA